MADPQNAARLYKGLVDAVPTAEPSIAEKHCGGKFKMQLVAAWVPCNRGVFRIWFRDVQLVRTWGRRVGRPKQVFKCQGSIRYGAGGFKEE